MDHIYRIPYDEAMQLSMDIFSACGMNGTDARMLSDSLVRADMRGVKSHGGCIALQQCRIRHPDRRRGGRNARKLYLFVI